MIARFENSKACPLKQEVLGDPVPDVITLKEDGKKIAVTLSAGQKTGAFLDQRDNRRAARGMPAAARSMHSPMPEGLRSN